MGRKLYYYWMGEKDLTPWQVELTENDGSLDQGGLKSFSSVVFCSTLKNLAQPLADNAITDTPKKFSSIKRVKSAGLCRYRSQELSSSASKEYLKPSTLKLQIQRLESIQYLSLSDKQPLHKQEPAFTRKQRISSATTRCHSQKKNAFPSHNNRPHSGRTHLKEEQILISQKIEKIIKITQTKSRLSSKVNSIIKGYVNIPHPPQGRHYKDDRFLRELITQRM